MRASLPSSAEVLLLGLLLIRPGLSPFFIRASAGPIISYYMQATAASQSLLHQGIGRTWRAVDADTAHQSQSLLHQGIGRTGSRSSSEEAFPSQSLLHQGIGRTEMPYPAAPGVASQSLLHQGIGRTRHDHCWNVFQKSQSLLHQGIGRTRWCRLERRAGAVSVPSSSGHRPDGNSTRLRHWSSVSVPSSSGHRPDSSRLRCEIRGRSQSLLHQGIGRTRRLSRSDRRYGLSPFFIRASAGRNCACAAQQRNCLSPFFIRASAGPASGESL